jgi:hypothetical protein
MFLTHLLQNLGVPAGVASALGIAGMLVKGALGGKKQSARGDHGQMRSRGYR